MMTSAKKDLSDMKHSAWEMQNGIFSKGVKLAEICPHTWTRTLHNSVVYMFSVLLHMSYKW